MGWSATIRRSAAVAIDPHLPARSQSAPALTALAIEQNDRWRQKRWLVEPTFIEQEPPMRRSACSTYGRRTTQDSALDLNPARRQQCVQL